ncbi:hypothetical protein E4U55_006972 [Claviceps digitariae]|nr:hypothetical protein E4U55_006972 [Claviceps digitariae]
MAVAPILKTLRNPFPVSRACINRILSPQYSQRLIHSKGSQSGEQGQFKAVTASQSSHEPSSNGVVVVVVCLDPRTNKYKSQEMSSKPPHKAASLAREKQEQNQRERAVKNEAKQSP